MLFKSKSQITQSGCSFHEETVNRNIIRLHFLPLTSNTTNPLLFGLLEEEWSHPPHSLSLPCFNPHLNSLSLFKEYTSDSFERKNQNRISHCPELSSTHLFFCSLTPKNQKILYKVHCDIILSPTVSPLLVSLFIFIFLCVFTYREGGPTWLILGFTQHHSSVSVSCINKNQKKRVGWVGVGGAEYPNANLPGKPDSWISCFGIKHKCSASSPKLVPARKCQISVCLWLELSVWEFFFVVFFFCAPSRSSIHSCVYPSISITHSAARRRRRWPQIGRGSLASCYCRCWGYRCLGDHLYTDLMRVGDGWKRLLHRCLLSCAQTEPFTH